jgi:2-isopropylmalate synthase
VEFSRVIQSITDAGGEIVPETIKQTFDKTYLNTTRPLAYLGHRSNFDSSSSVDSEVTAKVRLHETEVEISGSGNGPLSAFKNALENQCRIKINLVDYQEHAIGAGADATAAAYVEIETSDRQAWWGVGVDANIVTASFQALVSAINRAGGTVFT